MNPSQPKERFPFGCWTGDPGLLTVRGRQRIEEAEVVVYDYLVSEGSALYRAGSRTDSSWESKPENAPWFNRRSMRFWFGWLERETGCSTEGGDPFVWTRRGGVFGSGSGGVPLRLSPGLSSLSRTRLCRNPVTDRRYASSSPSPRPWSHR